MIRKTVKHFSGDIAAGAKGPILPGFQPLGLNRK
jgi:hypothetical protein